MIFQHSCCIGLRKSVLLSCIFHGEEDFLNEIPLQRLVFFVKHSIRELEKISLSPAVRGQILGLLVIVLRPVSEIYGEFWADILDIMQRNKLETAEDDTLFGIYASLRLLALLKISQMQQSNDDLSDAWKEKKGAIAERLLETMILLAGRID